MNKFVLVVLCAITMLYMSPSETLAGQTSTLFSVQYVGGQGHGGAHYKYGHGRGHGRGQHGRWRHHYYRGHRHREHYHRGSRYFWSGSIVIPWYPYWYQAPPPVIIQKEPRVYVQPEQAEDNYWYYCPDPQGYYPYIRQCAGGWMKVVPDTTPPNQ